MSAVFNILSDNVVILSGLKDEVSGAFMNTAVVEVTVVDRGGTPVSGQAWPTSMPYVASSDGVYRGTLSDALDLTKFESYTAQVTADAGPGLRQYWECAGPAQAASC